MPADRTSGECCIDPLRPPGLPECGSSFPAQVRKFGGETAGFVSDSQAIAAPPSEIFAILGCGTIRNKGTGMKGFPTIEEVERAGKEQLAHWYRFLPSGETAADQEIMKRIAQRFQKLGGMTPELSKKIGM
jgi:hypothetical protein